MRASKKKKAALLLSFLALGCLGASLLLSDGCWSSGPSVWGTVRLDGQPVASGSIRFVPLEGTPGPDAGTVIERGTYRIGKDLAVGQYRVEIRSPRLLPKKLKFNPAMPVELVADAEEAIPAEYNRQSKLIETLKAGANVLDFDLKETKKGK